MSSNGLGIAPPAINPDDYDEPTEPGRPQRVTVKEMLDELRQLGGDVRGLATGVASLADEVRELGARIRPRLTVRTAAISCARWGVVFAIFGALLWWIR